MSSVLKRKGAQVFVSVALATSALVAPTPASAVIRGTSFYTIVHGPSWTQAEVNAVGLGGHLVTINDFNENLWITNSFASLDSGQGLWIGLTDQFVENQFVWSSGDVSQYRNWEPGNPDNSTYFSPLGQDYVYLAAKGNPGSNTQGKWDDSTIVERGIKGIAEIPIAFSASQSAPPIEGSGLFTTSLFFSAGVGTNLVDGETIYWGLDGITADDLSTGTMNGFGVVTNGKLDITHSLFDDGVDEIENFIVTAYSDPLLRTSEYQIGSYSAPVRPASSSTASVPGPLPILGLSSVFYWTRRLRKRIKNNKTMLRIASAD